MHVLSLIEADDSVVEIEMLLWDDDSMLFFTASLNFVVQICCLHILWTNSNFFFRMRKATCEALVREIVATGHISIANRFGRESVDPTRQVMTYL